MLSVQHLYKLAGGFNIEGGFPAQDLLNSNPNALWVNLVLVLDRPLIDHHLFDDIAAKNPYPLLESAIANINEAQMLSIYLMTIGYYLQNGTTLLQKQDLNVCIHIHQDVTCKPLINIIKTYVDDLTHHFGIKNINVEYRNDTKWYQSEVYNDVDILISLSQCAGLASHLDPGSMIIPTTFIPYDIVSSTVYITRQYLVKNDLIDRMPEILESKYHSYAVEYIQKHYRSANPQKLQTANKSLLTDFHKTPILHVDRLWNPTNPNETIVLQ